MVIPVDRVARSGTEIFHDGQASNVPARQIRPRLVEPARASVRATTGRPSPHEEAEWELLLSAVRTRLSLTAGAAPAVLDCVHDLGLLQGMLAHDLGRFQQLELDLFDTRTALAQARAELDGTRAGEQRARHLAQHDSLTLLPNRSHFRERLDDALGLSDHPLRQPLAVLYLDLDGFKPINDRHGHDAGDELLRIVAARLSRAVRAGDMVSRLGGDEFACLLADLPGRQQLCQLACKLFDAVSAPVKVGKLQLTVRPSIGIAICPTDGATTDALLKSADAAMYAAKRDRTGYAFFTPGHAA
jgi:diguanylate cyclase (GGDEF)-like protein